MGKVLIKLLFIIVYAYKMGFFMEYIFIFICLLFSSRKKKGWDGNMTNFLFPKRRYAAKTVGSYFSKH